MRRLVAFSTFLVVLFAAGGWDLSACGEKFFFVGRLSKYQQTMAAPVPGAVLLYTNPASNLAGVLRQTKLDETLKAVGHKVDVVADDTKLMQALQSGRYDVLLVSAADMPRAAGWKPTAPAIAIVPVLYHATRAEQQAAQQASKSVVRAEKTNDAVMLVNNIIKSRPKTRATP